jgi:hypothetical protein
MWRCGLHPDLPRSPLADLCFTPHTTEGCAVFDCFIKCLQASWEGMELMGLGDKCLKHLAGTASTFILIPNAQSAI